MRPWLACTCLCLASLLSGCAERIVTKYEFRYVPDSLLVDCPITPKPENATFADWGELAEARYTDVENCNGWLKAIRQYQADQRAKDAKNPP